MMDDRRTAAVLGFCLASCSAQTTYTVASLQYTTVHYVLMAASLFLIASLVLGFLVMLRQDCNRHGSSNADAGSKLSRSRRQQRVIEVKPKKVASDPTPFAVSHQDLVVEDLDADLIRSPASTEIRPR